MRKVKLIGLAFVMLGGGLLFFLRDAVIRLFIFLLEFFGILLALLLIALGLAMLFGGRYRFTRFRDYRVVPENS